MIEIIAVITVASLIVTEVILIKEIRKFKTELVKLGNQMFGKIETVEKKVNESWMTKLKKTWMNQ